MMRALNIARELVLKGLSRTFAMIFERHPKTRQNPLREILLVHRQKYTWIFPVIFLGFPGLFRIFSGIFSGFSRKIFTKKWAGNTESRVRRRFRKSRVRRRFRESSSHSRFPYPGFFLVKIPEKSGQSVFRTPGTKIKTWIFFMIFWYDRYFLYKPLFPSS